MHAARMLECLTIIRWSPATLAQALNVNASKVEIWIDAKAEIPIGVASWLEALCFTHEASDLMRPAVEAVAPRARIEVTGHKAEHVPTYSYGLLRQLSQGPVSLRKLFGTDDEAAVFFLVSRGLAERYGADLKITAVGRKLGEVALQAQSTST